MTTPETMEERFKDKFVRSDGLIDKYHYGAGDYGDHVESTAEAIIHFIQDEIALAVQKREEELLNH